MKSKLAIFIALLLLAGCASPFFQRKQTLQLPEVSVGTKGVELSFAPNAPPREVYESTPFTLLATLSNLGTADVEDGVYSLSYERQYVYLSSAQNTGKFAVRGKSIFNPQGAERQLQFIFKTQPLGAQIEHYTTALTLNACYPYQTTAPATVCIDTDIFNKQKVKACAPQPQNYPQGQGAPVAVVSIEPRMLPHDDLMRIRPEFVLTLDNKGTGAVVAPDRYRDACSGRPLGEEGWNNIAVTAMLSDSTLTCTPTPVHLRQEGQTKVVCTLSEGIEAARGTYSAPLTVILNYGYLTSITTQVVITKLAP